MEENSRCQFHNCAHASKTPTYINKKNTLIKLAPMILLILYYQEPNLATPSLLDSMKLAFVLAVQDNINQST